MKTSLLSLLALVARSVATPAPRANVRDISIQHSAGTKPCKNTPTSRHCWGKYNIDTNYYTTTPDSGRTIEYWLSVEEGTCNQDGYVRPCMTFNGTMPGPPIIANWGDKLVVHVANNMKTNGTAVHWHGARLHHSNEWDGVPGVTQCPIAPGESLTYKFRVTQYGTSWYHSHFSLQSTEGLFGSLIFNGPATANYDEDLGPIFLQDWSHIPTFTAWEAKQKWGITHSQTTTLINGINTFNCSASLDPNCVGGGKKFEAVFKPGKKYRLRLINVAMDSQWRFSIDGHKLQVIANDFVPIEPYETDSVLINVGQRYDVIVEANATPGDYWLRGGWVKSCQGVANEHPDSATGIIRYDHSSISDPTSTTTIEAPKSCDDEPQKNLVPHLKLDVGTIADTTVEDINVRLTNAAVFQWTVNSSSLVLDWNEPTLKRVFDNASIFPTPYNVVEVDVSTPSAWYYVLFLIPSQKKNPHGDEWAVLVIENKAAAFFGGYVPHLCGRRFDSLTSS